MDKETSGISQIFAFTASLGMNWFRQRLELEALKVEAKLELPVLWVGVLSGGLKSPRANNPRICSSANKELIQD